MPITALSAIWTVVTLGNQFVEEKKPWILAKDPAKKSELANTLVILGESIAHTAVVLLPFLPKTASQILENLGLSSKLAVKEFKRPFIKTGAAIKKGEVLFPRLDEEKAVK